MDCPNCEKLDREVERLHRELDEYARAAESGAVPFEKRDERRFRAAVAFGAALVGRDDSVAWMQELFEERATKQQACEELADAAVRFADALLAALAAPAGREES